MIISNPIGELHSLEEMHREQWVYESGGTHTYEVQYFLWKGDLSEGIPEGFSFNPERIVALDIDSEKFKESLDRFLFPIKINITEQGWHPLGKITYTSLREPFVSSPETSPCITYQEAKKLARKFQQMNLEVLARDIRENEIIYLTPVLREEVKEKIQGIFPVSKLYVLNQRLGAYFPSWEPSHQNTTSSLALFN